MMGDGLAVKDLRNGVDEVGWGHLDFGLAVAGSKAGYGRLFSSTGAADAARQLPPRLSHCSSTAYAELYPCFL